MKKYDFTKVILTNIDYETVTKPVELVHKTIANIVFRSAQNLDLVEIARIINKGEAVELRSSEIAEIRKLMQSPQSGLFSFTQKAIFDYIDSVKEEI